MKAGGSQERYTLGDHVLQIGVVLGAIAIVLGLAASVYKAFAQAKRLSDAEFAETTALKIGLPWVNAEYDETRAVMGDESQARSEAAFDAAGTGDLVKLDLELERLWVADTQPAQIIRGALGHFQRLMLAKEGMARGDQLDNVMRKFFPSIHFSRADSFKAQARNWNAEKLADALDLLLEAEGLTRTTAMPAEAITGRTLFTIAALAKAR